MNMEQKQKRQLEIDIAERMYNSRKIESKYLIFDYFCDYDISDENCKNVEKTLEKCSQYIEKMITIKKTLHITVDYYTFCNDKDCSSKSSAVASSSPSSLFLLSDANGVEWSFPKALFKQNHYVDDYDYYDEDIYVQINNSYDFYFGVR
ncbi:hypothetical protein PIROE2DRAFT_13475 [Piromyces sp. E2]|nr:hypothetical protein PIROE2DRAFT_13475 [Piromyces sp. E2]|eukprot:OUM60701.1 hypothetical protein PIROE2DRAFT_13475 [Piromyces sp. E2]